MNKFVILGCGYIGTNLANYIAQDCNNSVFVIGIYNEYVDKLNINIKFIEKFIEQLDDDDKEIFNDAIVIDAVGNTNATNDIKTSRTLFLENCSNKVSLIKLLESFEIKKYIFLSSGGTVYNDSLNKHREDESVFPQSIYALEKVIIENYLKINSLENSNFKYLIFRISNPYGGIVSKNKKQGIIDVAESKIKNDECLDFYGDLNNIRDYIYIYNLAEYIYYIAIKDINNEIFNVGSGEGKSITEIMAILEKIYGKKLKLLTKKINTVNIRSNILDITKITNIVKLEHIYSIEEVLENNFKNRGNDE